jgi:MFS family permease
MVILEALRTPNYAIYAAGNSISLIGFWMQRIAVGWLIWELTESGGWLGLLAFADLFPSVIIGPIGGAMADRVDRLKIIVYAQSLAMILALVMFFLLVFGLMNEYLLLLIIFFGGLAMGFNQPSRLSLVPTLVPRELIGNAVAINAIVFNLARFIGPALAGVMIVAWGVETALLANALTYVPLLFALAILRRRVSDDPTSRTGKKGPKGTMLQEIKAGVSYAAGHPGIGPLLALLLAVSIGVRPFVELLPGFVADIFSRGADALATMTAILGLGSIAAGLWMAGRPEAEGMTNKCLLATAVVCLTILGFVATDSYYFALACMAVAGIAMTFSGVGAQVLLQTSIADEMRGRVLSLYGIIFRGGPAAGALIIGAASEFFGLRWPLAVGVCLSLMVWLYIWFRRGTMRQAMEINQQENKQ